MLRTNEYEDPKWVLLLRMQPGMLRKRGSPFFVSRISSEKRVYSEQVHGEQAQNPATSEHPDPAEGTAEPAYAPNPSRGDAIQRGGQTSTEEKMYRVRCRVAPAGVAVRSFGGRAGRGGGLQVPARVAG